MEQVGVGNGAMDDSSWARRRKLRIQTRVFLVGYRASARPYHHDTPNFLVDIIIDVR
jgi:hypothetical protein